MLDKLKKFHTFSFVFEGILDDEVNGDVNPRKEEFQKLAIDLINEGKYVFIYTKYHSYKTILSKNLDEIYISKYKRVEEITSKIGIDLSRVVWSNRSVHKHLSDDKNHCHFECSDYETILIRNYKPSIKTFNINEVIL